MNDTCGGNDKTCENKSTHKPNPRIAPKLDAILALATGIRSHHNISQPLFLHSCNRKQDHQDNPHEYETREMKRFHLDGTSP